MVMMATAAQPVVEAAILQEYAAEYSQFAKELYGAKSGGPPHVGHLAEDVLDREVATLAQHGSEDSHPRRCDPVLAGFQASGNGVEFSHN